MNLNRLLRPATILAAGGRWVEPIVHQNRKLGFSGRIERLHPKAPAIAGARTVRDLAGAAAAPDACFLAVNRKASIDMAAALAAMDAGGLVCFAAGFEELHTEEGQELGRQLCAAAGPVPFLGPNCYGFINYLDGVALWPDQVADRRVDRGVALISQSGTIGITLGNQQRSLPVGYLVTVGNQARVTIEDLIHFMVADPRVTAIGLYVEGFRDIAAFVAAARAARDAGKAIVAVKAGRTEGARRTLVTHTAAVAGDDRIMDALFERLGIGRCATLAELCETLKVLHTHGPLASPSVCVMGCSGGDMAMAADCAASTGLRFPPMPAAAARELTSVLGDRVPIANPLDYNTGIWFDPAAMGRVFATSLAAGYAAVANVTDFPDPASCDPGDFEAALDVYLEAARCSDTPAAILSSLPETLPQSARAKCADAGVVPLQGLAEGLHALDVAARIGEAWRRGGGVRVRPGRRTEITARTEDEAKSLLERHGVSAPARRTVAPSRAARAAADLGFPVAMKASDAHLSHKTDAGGVFLDIETPAAAESAAQRLACLCSEVLVERMIGDGVAEILLGIIDAPQVGPVMIVGSGGTLAELMSDRQVLLLPFGEDDARRALGLLATAPALGGWRGRPAGDIDAVVAAMLRLGRLAEALGPRLAELEINPLIVRPRGCGAVAADAVLRFYSEGE